jgi:hypothetical protein
MISSLNRFMLIGNGGGGTSLLRGLLNAHSELKVLFEDNKGGGTKTPEGEIERWIKLSKESDLMWANKVPIEQFKSRGWTNDDVVSLAEQFKIVWLIRRFSKYWKGKTEGVYRENWQWSQELYWLIREAYPDRIIQVSFEDLLLRTVAELRRICNFLDVKYEANMLKGTSDTGLGSYNQATINKDKV